jgi:hypothetical protein
MAAFLGNAAILIWCRCWLLQPELMESGVSVSLLWGELRIDQAGNSSCGGFYLLGFKFQMHESDSF